MVNIIHEAPPDLLAKIWAFIKEIKASWSLDIGINDALLMNEISAENMLKTVSISNYLRDLETEFNLTNISQESIHDQIKEDTYKTGCNMFLYLAIFPPKYEWFGWMSLYKDLLQSFSLKKIVTTLAGISSNSEEKELSNNVLEQMFDILNMTHKKTENVTLKEKIAHWSKTGKNWGKKLRKRSQYNIV